MNGASLGFIVEALVATLLIITIGYCAIVNRKLERLRSEKSDLRAVIRDLYSATGNAEQALANLRQTAGSIEETLGGQVSAARKTQSQLAGDIKRGEGLLSKLELLTHGGTSALPVRQSWRGPAGLEQREVRNLAAGRGEAPELKLRHSEMGLGLLNAQRGKSHLRDDDAKEVA